MDAKMATLRRVAPMGVLLLYFLVCLSTPEAFGQNLPKQQRPDFVPQQKQSYEARRDIQGEGRILDTRRAPKQPIGEKPRQTFNQDFVGRRINPNFDQNGQNRPPVNPNPYPAEKKRNLGAAPMVPHAAGNLPQQPAPGRNLPRKIAPTPIKIAETPQCANDVKHLCSASSLNNNFAVLDCLQNDVKGDSDVSTTCQHFIWSYKKNLTMDIRFDSAANEVCKNVLENELPECHDLPNGVGQVIPCLIDHKANVTDPSCKQFLTKMASIVFSDYRLIFKFADSCGDDIMALNCGRINTDSDGAPHSQGKTVECLSNNVKSLNEKCKHEILRIAELQADDYHMDRPLFYACREDRERFCSKAKAGGGKIYRCLFRHKFDRAMSTACQEKLTQRQKLVREDYKVNKQLAEACRKDIKTYHCLKGDIPETKQGKLSTVLLCLEGMQAEEHPVTPECVAELREMRRALMEDYKISPQIVAECASEIKEHCGGGLQREGKTLHCLMDLARPRKKGKGDFRMSKDIGKPCQRELEEVLREADAGEDFRMDPVLHEACNPIAETACKDVKPGDASVMACLMEKIGTDKMTDDCEERLMELQYFVSRDFKLDSQLYKYCKADATQFCHAPPTWYDPEDTTPDLGPMVFTCLYRQTKSLKLTPKKENVRLLSRACAFEVKRIMRQRAVSIDLEPRIEEPCMLDLGQLCSEDTEKGEEISCLQNNMDKLQKECRWAVANFTEDEDEDPQLDKILMRACTPMIKEFCDDLLEKENTEAGDVMECLIKHKNHANMNRKCAAGVEHHQLISLSDFNFSYKFKDACKSDVLKLCRGMRKKFDVVKCLSETIRNDTLQENDQRLTRQCRKQVRFELLQRNENIKLDPDLEKACQEDVREFCSNVSPGQSQVIECLKKHQSELRVECGKKIFKREQINVKDSSVDYLLVSTCKSMIKRHCMKAEPARLLHCLKEYKDDMDFDIKCRKVISDRQVIQNKDYRLKPDLAKSCKLDIPKFCKAEMMTDSKGLELEGRVINCLKNQYRKHRLSRDCEAHVRDTIRDAALDYRQDPVLAHACEKEIHHLCRDKLESVDQGRGKVEECLKVNLQMKKIDNPECIKEVSRLLAESQADIHVDPLLHRACALDIKHYCHDVPPGEGRQMSCLLAALDDKTVRLKMECHKMLSERVEMWEYAAKVAPPETLGELYLQMTTSKARGTFVSITLCFLGVIFLGGLFCGRVTKRVRAEVKNK